MLRWLWPPCRIGQFLCFNGSEAWSKDLVPVHLCTLVVWTAVCSALLLLID